jgi:hypothetical protein
MTDPGKPEDSAEVRGAWFSAQTRLVCFIDGVPQYFRDTIHLLRAEGWDEALKRAIALGRRKEAEYQNANSVLVRWKLREVLTLDILAEGELDGAEVHSELAPLEVALPLEEDELDPERSEPVRTS